MEGVAVKDLVCSAVLHSAEERIHTKLLKDGHIDTVIGLPAGLFYSSRSPVCILVLKKCKKPTFDTPQAIAVMLEKHGIACDLMHGFNRDKWTTGKSADRSALVPTRKIQNPAVKIFLASRSGNVFSASLEMHHESLLPAPILRDFALHFGLPRDGGPECKNLKITPLYL